MQPTASYPQHTLAAEPAQMAGWLGLRFGFHVFLLFFFDGFGLTMARYDALFLITLILMLGGLFAIALILSSPTAMSLCSRAWPLLALCGLAFASAAWSVEPRVTLNKSLQLTFTVLMGIALVGRLGSREALRHIIRNLSLICVLSVIWALAFPDLGLHQATDKTQFQHAGLWRGIFTHKIMMGCVAGMTFGLVVFYGPRAFSNVVSYSIALISAAACIVGSGSATGFVSVAVMTTMLFVSYRMVLQREQLRRPLLRIALVAIGLITFLMFSGVLDELATLLDRSSDLTGRADYWPFVLDFVNSSSPLLGYGYGAGFDYVGEMIAYDSGLLLKEAHNGAIEMVVAFGYPGAALVIWVHIWLLKRTARQLMRVPRYAVMIGVFPFSFVAALLMSSYAESIILEYRGFWTLIFSVAMCISIKIEAILRSSASSLDGPAGEQPSADAVQPRLLSSLP